MSAPEFRALFNNPAFNYWFDKTLSNKKHPYSSFVHQTRDSSKKMIANSMVDFVLTKETLSNLVGETRASAVFKEIQSTKIFDELGTYRNIDGQEQILFPNLKFSNLNKTIESFLNAIGESAGQSKVGTQATNRVNELEIHKGHVFGFTNTLINLTKEDIRKAGVTTSETELKALDEFIDALINVLEEFDIKSSDVKGLDLEINAKYRKTSSNWLIEWQGALANVTSGSQANRVIGKTGASTFTGARGVFTAGAQKNKEIMEKVINNFIQNFIDESVAAPDSSALNILQQKSSPSMKDLIVDSLVSTITGKKRKLATEYTGAISLPNIQLVTVKNKNNNSIKQEISKLKNIKNKAKAKISKEKIKGYTTSPMVSLEALLRANINERVKQNMGKGNDKKILNYRTGRLADSVSIERLSESRAGMVTAFYNYMRNPYGTFSEGGRQQYPRTRDPKLLISKSIREIGATMVGTRMRAVLV